MIAIFCDNRQFSAKKLAFFSQTTVIINFLHNLALFGVKMPIFSPLFLAKFFSKNHNIGPRWKSGDHEVLEAVRMFAQFTEEARTALEDGDWTTLAKLMNQVQLWGCLHRTLFSCRAVSHDTMQLKFGSIVCNCAHGVK
jgi:hypothetical protein